MPGAPQHCSHPSSGTSVEVRNRARAPRAAATRCAAHAAGDTARRTSTRARTAPPGAGLRPRAARSRRERAPTRAPRDRPLRIVGEQMPVLLHHRAAARGVHARCSRRPDCSNAAMFVARERARRRRGRRRARAARRSTPGRRARRSRSRSRRACARVARLVSANSPSITQPRSSATVPRVPSPCGVVRALARSACAWTRASPSRSRADRAAARAARRCRVRALMRPPSIASASSEGRAKTNRIARATSGSAASPSASRASPRANARTGRRTGTQSRTRGSRGSGRCACARWVVDARACLRRSARMSTMRPRGLSFSSSRVRYVGHACRQKPQCTHASMPALLVGERRVGNRAGRAIDVGSAVVTSSVAEDPGVEHAVRIERATYAADERLVAAVGRQRVPELTRAGARRCATVASSACEIRARPRPSPSRVAGSDAAHDAARERRVRDPPPRSATSRRRGHTLAEAGRQVPRAHD